MFVSFFVIVCKQSFCALKFKQATSHVGGLGPLNARFPSSSDTEGHFSISHTFRRNLVVIAYELMSKVTYNDIPIYTLQALL